MRGPPYHSGRSFVDSSGNLPILDRRDEDRIEAIAIRDLLIDTRGHMFTSNFVVDESYTLIMSNLGTGVALRFLIDLYASSITVERISRDDEDRAEVTLLLRRCRDTPAE